MSRPISMGWSRYLLYASAVCAIALLMMDASTFGASQGGEKGKKDDVRKVVEKVKGSGAENKSRGKKDSKPASDKNKPAAETEVKDASSPRMGKIVINTNPSEAEVIIKNKDGVVKQGRSREGRFETELEPGEYDLEVTSPKYSTFEGKATISSGGREILKVNLIQTGWIIIDLGSVDAEVSILIDGKEPSVIERAADNKVELRDIPKGKHTLRFSHPTIKELEQIIEVEGGAQKYFSPVFELVYGKLIVKSEPGADVYIDSNPAGKIGETGAAEIFDLKPGRHTIRVEKEGFAPKEITKDILAGENLVEITLTRLKPQR